MSKQTKNHTASFSRPAIVDAVTALLEYHKRNEIKKKENIKKVLNLPDEDTE